MPSIAEIVTGVHFLVGAQAVISMDAKTSQIVNNFYPGARDEVLAAAEWNFAMARKQLSQLEDDPAFEFTYQYSLPTDPYCLRAVEVYNTESVWKVEGRKLLIDDDEVYLRYISRITDSMQFSPLFVTALQYYLASKCAFPIMRDRGLGGQYYEIYMKTIADALTANSMEGMTSTIENNTLTDTRL